LIAKGCFSFRFLGWPISERQSRRAEALEALFKSPRAHVRRGEIDKGTAAHTYCSETLLEQKIVLNCIISRQSWKFRRCHSMARNPFSMPIQSIWFHRPKLLTVKSVENDPFVTISSVSFVWSFLHHPYPANADIPSTSECIETFLYLLKMILNLLNPFWAGLQRATRDHRRCEKSWKTRGRLHRMSSVTLSIWINHKINNMSWVASSFPISSSSHSSLHSLKSRDCDLGYSSRSQDSRSRSLEKHSFGQWKMMIWIHLSGSLFIQIAKPWSSHPRFWDENCCINFLTLLNIQNDDFTDFTCRPVIDDCLQNSNRFEVD
jgi:hypothetical protein